MPADAPKRRSRRGLSTRSAEPRRRGLVKPLVPCKAWGMSETSVRALHEDDWRDYRAVRLAALQEATYAEEATEPEQYWRNCMVRAHPLLAERDGAAVGVASVEMIKGAPHSADSMISG
jgi:hypothetical protein